MSKSLTVPSEDAEAQRFDPAQGAAFMVLTRAKWMSLKTVRSWTCRATEKGLGFSDLANKGLGSSHFGLECVNSGSKGGRKRRQRKDSRVDSESIIMKLHGHCPGFRV